MLFNTKEGAKKRRRRRLRERNLEIYLRLSAIPSALFQVICRAKYGLTTLEVKW